MLYFYSVAGLHINNKLHWYICLQVSVALLFCTGMPLCAAVVVLVFGVASLMDRWAVTQLM